jgi:hypothetical protein
VTKTATKPRGPKGTGGAGIKCKSKSYFDSPCEHVGDHTNRHSWDTGDYRRKRKAAEAAAPTPALYDPVNDPKGAAKADAYLEKKAVESSTPTPAPVPVTDVAKIEPVAPAPAVAAPTVIDVVVSFDTTGSMSPCIAQVRREVDVLIQRLFKDIPQIQIGIIAHGDYCDGSRAISKQPITTDAKKLCDFVRTVPNTSGGDEAECYEYVLHEARTYNWRAGGHKVLVLIGDELPHGQHEAQNFKHLDWREELKALRAAGVGVYAIQALGKKHSEHFYKEVAVTTGGFYLPLDQFAQIGDMITAICLKQVSNERLQEFERSCESNGRMNRSYDRMFSTLLGRATGAAYTGSRTDGLVAVKPSRFQVLMVTKDTDIKEFVESNSIAFASGRGFYEFTKSVEVQSGKEVILQERKTGDMFSGREARQILGLSDHGTQTINPHDIAVLRDGTYTAFIQSTSNNRKLLAGTRFLYETG